MDNLGRTPHGVRGLKSKLNAPLPVSDVGRTPHGVRGLKFTFNSEELGLVGSHPSWGAWIEIGPWQGRSPAPDGRTPHGVRGLK